MTNFFDIVIYGYWLCAGYGSYIIWRDRKNPTTVFGQYKKFSLGVIIILLFGAVVIFDAHFIEPWTIRTTPVAIDMKNLTAPIKIAFVSDIQVGNHKKSEWVEKIVERIKQEKPDLVLLGGDQIDNEGTFEDESVYLEPLKKLVGEYPIYAVMGNHEYGIGNRVRDNSRYWSGDRSQLEIDRFKQLNIPILHNDLICPEIQKQKICLYGVDDPWGSKIDYTNLKNWNQTTPLVLLTHNPDAVMTWPDNITKPNLTLAGHTHGGQIYLPIIGPLGSAGIDLPKKYYRGLNDYHDIPIYTSVGIGESGGQLRFWTLPEIAIITLKPQE
ncbi:MAG: hypothetical protein A2261_03180 [Candidatus Magasanikbacteria bacterium RIFOXYA2_FULL_44_8]|uniref:Calcineurin-like phosphoesterase domain-containing protein n=1 Tax=Candidatus Magasanikbacteria bacterium RIFOXYA2_FULL_44_8 TaxID=1798696 RepID=A0A1F6NLI3_9BACT|nr:MAG: hypothetical protein A2261_03180 [Candidatus Magasanikbacteria bacterium RIFOXYA2_FULL_44_8]